MATLSLPLPLPKTGRCTKSGSAPGEVTITLPLGTYTISEVQAPYGFVHTDHTYTVVLDWDNQYNDLVLAKTIIDHTQDGDVVYNYSIINIGNASAEQIEKQVLAFEAGP